MNHLAIDDYSWCRHDAEFHDLRQFFHLAQFDGDSLLGGNLFDQFDRVAAVGTTRAENLNVFHVIVFLENKIENVADE